MSYTVLTATFSPPVFSEKEALRYAGCAGADEEIKSRLRLCFKEANSLLKYSVCYCLLPLKINKDICDFGVFSVKSKDLCKNLLGCSEAVIFAATVGSGLDLIISRHSRLSPHSAVLLQGIGAERIEALCDEFCRYIEREYGKKTNPRFSPGYGDLSLECQRDIFSVIGCEKRIGLTLSESLIMAPSKSVTAIVGMRNL